MIQWFYLMFGFALIFTFLRGADRRGFWSRTAREIWLDSFRLAGALGISVAVNSFFSFFLWRPAGRSDLGLISLFLWAFLIDEGMSRLGRGKRDKIRIVVSRSFLALVGFSLWGIESQQRFPPVQGFLWTLALPFGMGVFESLLEGLRERLKLSNLPAALEGSAILFWLAMLLSLVLGGLGGMARYL